MVEDKRRQEAAVEALKAEKAKLEKENRHLLRGYEDLDRRLQARIAEADQ